MGDLTSRAAIRRERKKCAGDFYYFCRRYLDIRDEDGIWMRLRPRAVQKLAIHTVENVNPLVFILKARKRGISTMVAAYFFWRACFEDGFGVLLIAQSQDDVQEIFQIYARFYERLPGPMQPPLKKGAKDPTVKLIEFAHGARIKAQTAGTAGKSAKKRGRGGTWQAAHLSEFALYDTPMETIKAAVNACGDNAQVVLETTAQGLNEAHKLWYGVNGYEKLFISWKDDPSCRLKKRPYDRKDRAVVAAIQQVVEYCTENGCDEEQINWGVWKFLNKSAADFNAFLQEYPLNPDDAFISSGQKFFPMSFPGVKATPGYTVYENPKKFAVYTIGVDVAGGEKNGDYSAFCVLDVTKREGPKADQHRPRIVSTYYRKVPPFVFAQHVHAEALRYGALAVVERNNYGLSVIEALNNAQYSLQYRRDTFDVIENRWAAKLGFVTGGETRNILLGRILEYATRGWLPILDPTLQSEINSFVWRKKGNSDVARPEHEVGKHDDMIFAVALALMGLDQISPVEQEIERQKPQGLREMLQFEKTTGKLYQSETSGPGGQSPSQMLLGIS